MLIRLRSLLEEPPHGFPHLPLMQTEVALFPLLIVRLVICDVELVLVDVCAPSPSLILELDLHPVEGHEDVVASVFLLVLIETVLTQHLSTYQAFVLIIFVARTFRLR